MVRFAIFALVFLAVMPTVEALTLLRPMTSRARAITTAAVVAGVALCWVVVPWAWLGMHLRWLSVLTALGALAIGWAFGKRREEPEGWFALASEGVTAIALAVIAVFGWAASIPPDGDGIELTFPIRDGAFVVLQGGTNVVLNQHALVRAGQTLALDVGALGPGGRKQRRLLPTRLDEYAVFGEPLYAPCAGEVVAAESSLADLAPGETPNRDIGTVAGNFVLLACGTNTVLLAHLSQGSVVPAVGDVVAVGDPIGRVGNSGNTSEPHLHIHAVRGVVRTVDEVTSEAPPMPMTFGGRFLVRNDVVR
jgi:hypothetical protein